MFRHDLIGVEHSVRTHAALRDAAAAFFKKIRQNSLVDNRNAVRRVSHAETHSKPISVAFERSVFHQATDPKRAANRSFFRRDLCRTKKEDEIISEGTQYQPRRQSQRSQADNDKDNSFMTLFHKLRC